MTGRPELIGTSCPRCRRPAQVRYYGPCEACRGELRRTLRIAPRAVAPEPFEPAMHVTPNAVATKD